VPWRFVARKAKDAILPRMVHEKSGRRARMLSEDDMTPEEFAARFGEGIRAARQSRAWTQVQLAEAAGLSSNYVARLERGELSASLFVAHQLCTALDSDVVTILNASRGGLLAGVRSSKTRVARTS
jgi:ribosome-binding protein aMBF1 (putative translation factor)